MDQFSKWLPRLVSIALLTMPLLTWADQDDEIDALRRALESQQEANHAQQEALEQQARIMEQQAKELDRLMRRLDALEGNTQEGLAQPAAAVADAAPEEQPPVAPDESPQENQATMEIYGFAQADLIHDFGRMDPDWKDGFRPSRIPTDPGKFGSDNQSSISVKQSRFGVAGAMPTGANNTPLNYKFEFDLFGVGADAGQTTFRLRHAFGEWGSLLAGQTHSLLMDINAFPNTIDYWGPAGMVFLRNPQIRWTPLRSERSSFAVALEHPSDDIDPGAIRILDPELGEKIQSNEEFPDLTARWKTRGDWGHFQAGGILRRIGFDSRDTPNNEPKGSETGWGINLSTNINVLNRDRIVAQLVYGEGIASYMNDGGTDLAPGGTLLNPKADTVSTTGLVLYYDRWWNDRWSTSIGYSLNRQGNTSLQTGDAMHKGEYASVNLLHHPGDNLLIGAELLYGQRTDKDGQKGDDLRFQFSAKYLFSVSPWPRAGN
jgi:hypothetical protein